MATAFRREGLAPPGPVVSGADEPKRRRIGLTLRAILAFGSGATLVSVTLGVTTYAVAHHYLLSRRQSSAVTQAFDSARLVKQELEANFASASDVLESLVTPEGTRSLIYRRGVWYSTSASVGPAGLPASLVALVRARHPAEQRIMLDGQAVTAVGVPLPAIGVDFYQVRSLSDLQGTLGTLGAILAAAVIIAAAAGSLFGWWGGRRLMRPLAEVAEAATAITDGQLDRRLPVDRDADLGALATSFNRMVTKLEDRIKRDARFASDVSHELRSPLTALSGSVEMFEIHRAELSDEGRRALDLLQVETGRFSTMVQDLLEISRMDANVVTLEVEDLPLGEFVKHVAARHGGEVVVEVNPGVAGVVLRADKRRLQRVLANLLDNARVHGGGPALVVVSAEHSVARIVVDDNGRGIAPGDEELIFERFYRGTAAAGRRGSGKGTGLGLALSREHVRAHGGRLSAQNRPGGGARFVIELPVDEP